MGNERVIPCRTCDSEGRIYRGLYEDERDCGPCPDCEATGGEIIETDPVELDDLPVVSEPPLRRCSYCRAWYSRPCGEGCAWSPDDPTQ